MTRRSRPHPQLSRRLLSAMALASLAIAACGARVIGAEAGETTGGNGGHGGAGSNGGAGVTSGFGGELGPFQGVVEGSGAGTPGCSVQASPPEEIIQICWALGCPDAGAPDGGALESQAAQFAGLCDPSTSPCCGMPTLEQIVCGPDTSTGVCCYEAVMSPMHACTGAPVHDGAAR